LTNISFNCDLGEGIGNDALIMPYLSACSIACGGHFGTDTTIQKAVELAIKHKVKIGAHPSYPDKTNFGRQSLNISANDLQQRLREQLNLFNSILLKNEVNLHHIKAHGALYNDIAKNKKLALTFLEAISTYKNQCVLFVPNQSVIKELAIQQGFQIVLEAFADRNYTDDLQLVSRSQTNAIIYKPQSVIAHVTEMVNTKHLTTISGKKIPVHAETFCIHGDHENAVDIARELYHTFNTKSKKLSNIQLAYKAFGTNAVLIEWLPQKISTEVLQDIQHFQKIIETKLGTYVIECIPAYASLTVLYKNISFEALVSILKTSYQKNKKDDSIENNNIWHLPVCYHHSLGFDLSAYAKKIMLSVTLYYLLFRFFTRLFIFGWVGRTFISPQKIKTIVKSTKRVSWSWR